MMVIILSCLALYFTVAMIPGYVMLRSNQTADDDPFDLLKLLPLSGLFVPALAVVTGLDALSKALFPPKKG